MWISKSSRANSSSTIFKLLKEQEAKEKSNKSEFEDNFTSTKNKYSDKLTGFFNRFELNTQQIGSFVQNLVNQVELQNKTTEINEDIAQISKMKA